MEDEALLNVEPAKRSRLSQGLDSMLGREKKLLRILYLKIHRKQLDGKVGFGGIE